MDDIIRPFIIIIIYLFFIFFLKLSRFIKSSIRDEWPVYFSGFTSQLNAVRFSYSLRQPRWLIAVHTLLLFCLSLARVLAILTWFNFLVLFYLFYFLDYFIYFGFASHSTMLVINQFH